MVDGLSAFWVDDEAGGGGLGQNPLRLVDYVSFGNCDGSSHRRNLADATKETSFGCDRSQVIDCEVECGVSNSPASRDWTAHPVAESSSVAASLPWTIPYGL